MRQKSYNTWFKESIRRIDKFRQQYDSLEIKINPEVTKLPIFFESEQEYDMNYEPPEAIKNPDGSTFTSLRSHRRYKGDLSFFLRRALDIYELDKRERTIEYCLKWIEIAYSYGMIIEGEGLLEKLNQSRAECQELKKQLGILVAYKETLEKKLKQRTLSSEARRELK